MYPAKTYQDLAFLIPEGFQEGDPAPDKFLVFFDNRKEAEAAAKYLHRRLPKSLQDKVKWFHSITSPQFHEAEVEALRNDQAWGYACTDSWYGA